MRKFLLYFLFVIFLTVNINKWYVTVGSGVRIYYNHVALLVWLGLAIPYLQGVRFLIPSGIKLLFLVKILFFGVVMLGFPTLESGFSSPALTTYVKAVVVATLEGTGLLLMLLFVVHLPSTERRTVVNLYLAAIAVTLTVTLLQGWAIYQWNIDLDRVIGAHLPFWNGSVRSMDEEVFGLASGTYYRLSGLTGDPNLNGMIFLLALPVLFFRTFERGSLIMVVMLVLLLGAILLTVSNTVILLTPPVLLMLILRYRNRSRWIKLGAGLAFAGLGVAFLIRYGAEIQETLSFKLDLDKHGTASSHVSLAIEALAVWREHPFGVGANSYPRYSPEYSVHNSYLQTLVELGPQGLLLSLSWILVCLGLCWRAREGFGYAVLVAVGALAVGANGHDFLNRFEFQLVLNLFVAIAVLNHCDLLASRRSAPAPSTGTSVPSGLSPLPTHTS